MIGSDAIRGRLASAQAIAPHAFSEWDSLTVEAEALAASTPPVKTDSFLDTPSVGAGTQPGWEEAAEVVDAAEEAAGLPDTRVRDHITEAALSDTVTAKLRLEVRAMHPIGDAARPVEMSYALLSENGGNLPLGASVPEAVHALLQLLHDVTTSLVKDRNAAVEGATCVGLREQLDSIYLFLATEKGPIAVGQLWRTWTGRTGRVIADPEGESSDLWFQLDDTNGPFTVVCIDELGRFHRNPDRLLDSMYFSFSAYTVLDYSLKERMPETPRPPASEPKV